MRSAIESASSSAGMKLVCYRHTQPLSRNLIPYGHQCFIKRESNLIFTPQITFGGAWGGLSISSFISTAIRSPSLHLQNQSSIMHLTVPPSTSSLSCMPSVPRMPKPRPDRLWHCDPGVDSVSNRNEKQGYLLGDKGGRCLGLTTSPTSCADCLEILAASTSWNPKGVSRPAQGELYLYPSLLLLLLLVLLLLLLLVLLLVLLLLLVYILII
jgi:hypothetical protein